MKEFLPIAILLVAIWVVLARLPKIDINYSQAFRKRRVMNWLPLGLTYAFLYMGRYNLTVSKNAFGDLMSKADFGTIFAVGTVVYGFAFVINGPLTDKLGGRLAMLIAASGTAAMNFLMGLITQNGIATVSPSNRVMTFSVLYGLNMYFQSFGAVSIVKVNAQWFHLRERGTFGGIFGILISLGLYFAYDWSAAILKATSLPWLFYSPAIILMIFWAINFVIVKDSPSQAGHAEIETADAELAAPGQVMTVIQVAKKMFRDPVIMTIVAIEFCSGYLRNAIMQWYIILAKETGISESFVPKNWGLLLCCAGILGGVFAGTISDRIFHSRRGPVSAILYLGMLVGSLALFGIISTPYVGWLVVFMSMCIIGVHGMLSGTASMDFGGKKNVGVAVGMIDGFVYLGTALQSIVYGSILPKAEAAKDMSNWSMWPVAMMPIALFGFLLCLKIWNAKPKSRHAAH